MVFVLQRIYRKVRGIMEQLYKELDKLVEQGIISDYDYSDSFTDSSGNNWVDILMMTEEEE